MYSAIRFLIVFMVCEQYSIFILQASHYRSSKKTSNSSQFPLTPEELQVRKEQQAMVIHSEVYKQEIGTFTTLCNQIDQEFMYGQPTYEDIELKEFAEKYSEFIDICKQDAQLECQISWVINKKLQDSLKKNPTKRDISNCRIIGEMPGIESDSNGVDQSDRLFDINIAKAYVMQAVQNYIDYNYEDVYEKCCPQPQVDSKKILKVPCCKVQFHEKCLLSCQAYKVSSCPNSRCQVAENGKHYSQTWDTNIYEQIFQGKSLSRKEITTGTCMLCEDALKIDIPVNSPLATLRKRAGIYYRDFVKYKK